MNKQDIYDLLRQQNLWHEITEHKAVYSMADLADVEIRYPQYDAKNLFIRDDRKDQRSYYLITVKGEKRVNLKELRRNRGTRPLSFATPEKLKDILGLLPGAVSPLGLLNDVERKVTLLLDDDFMDEDALIGVHPNDNTATVWLKAKDLVDMVQEHGNPVFYTRI